MLETILSIVIVVLLLVTIGLIIFFIVKNNKKANAPSDQNIQLMLERENHSLTLKLMEQNAKNLLEIQKIKEEMVLSVQSEVSTINEKVEKRIGEGLKESNETVKSLIERLAKIDEAQKNMSSISQEIISLQSVLTDKSSRGAFGEVQLSQILHAVYGDKNDKLFREQHTFSTGTRADAVLFAPAPLGAVAIDSKFPLENYRKINEEGISKEDREKARRLLSSDIKKHIDDIAKKYIIPGITSDHAMMFIPSEAVYSEIISHHEKQIEYAATKSVWITSPTTLMATLTLIQSMVKNIEQSKYASIIQEQLISLSDEFIRFESRFSDLETRFAQANKSFADINVTVKKITKRFHEIEAVDKGEDDDDDNN